MLVSLTQVILLMDVAALETLLFWLSGGLAYRSLWLLVTPLRWSIRAGAGR